MLQVTFELGKETGNVCLRRNRRPPQALPGGGHRPGWHSPRQPQREQRRDADPVGDRRPAAGHPGSVRGRVRLGMASRASRGLRLRAAPGAPAAVQGHRVGAAEERQGRRSDLGAAAARGPAARGVDRAAGGAPAAGATAAPRPAGTAADAAAQPDPRSPGRPRLRPAGGLLERAGPGLDRPPGPSRHLGGGSSGRPGAHRRRGISDRPARHRDPRPRPVRPTGQRPDPACACRKPMPPGDTHESRHRRGHAGGRGRGPGG